jgi:myosin-5
LHFENACISGASVQTFLLERARVTGFVNGECNYHIFYQLLMGVASSTSSSSLDSKSMRARLGLPSSSPEGASKTLASFNYLNCRVPTSTKPTSKQSKGDKTSVYKSLRSLSRDETDFQKVVDALASVGINEKEREDIFAVVAAVLHLGNVEIGTQSSSDSDNAELGGTDAEASLKRTSALAGVDSDTLLKALCERSMKVAGETVTKKLAVGDARRTRDAAAKQMYSFLFDYICMRINSDLSPTSTQTKKKEKEKRNKTGLSTIGVLDIFGFETFKHNGLTQLLIAFSATLLHGVFLQKIFDAELSLYLSEGLLTDDDDVAVSMPENKQTIELLQGVPDKKQKGLLDLIVDQGRMPNASDTLMNRELHRQLAGHKSFPKPHPKDVDYIFKVVHFAGVVSYTVGSFLEMNHDHCECIRCDRGFVLLSWLRNVIVCLFEFDC